MISTHVPCSLLIALIATCIMSGAVCIVGCDAYPDFLFDEGVVWWWPPNEEGS